MTAGCVPLEPAGLKSFLKVELNLSHACSKDSEPKPTALLRCVLQALAIQGDLQHKIKLFSKSKQHYSLLNLQYLHHLFIPSRHLIPVNVTFAPHFLENCDQHMY